MFKYYLFNRNLHIIYHSNNLSDFKLISPYAYIDPISGICYLNKIIEYDIFKNHAPKLDILHKSIIVYTRQLIVSQILDFVP